MMPHHYTHPPQTRSKSYVSCLVAVRKGVYLRGGGWWSAWLGRGEQEVQDDSEDHPYEINHQIGSVTSAQFRAIQYVLYKFMGSNSGWLDFSETIGQESRQSVLCDCAEWEISGCGHSESLIPPLLAAKFT